MFLTCYSKRLISTIETTDPCSEPKGSQKGDGVSAGPKASADLLLWDRVCPQARYLSM